MIIKNITDEQMIEIFTSIGDLINTPDTFDTAVFSKMFKRKYAFNSLLSNYEINNVENLQVDVESTMIHYNDYLNSILEVTMTDIDPFLLTNVKTDDELEILKNIIDDFNSSKIINSTNNSTDSSNVTTADIDTSVTNTVNNDNTTNSQKEQTEINLSDINNAITSRDVTNSKNTYNNQTMTAIDTEHTDDTANSSTTSVNNSDSDINGTTNSESNGNTTTNHERDSESTTNSIAESILEQNDSSVEKRELNEKDEHKNYNTRLGFENINYYDALTTLYRLKEKNWYTTLMILIRENIATPWLDMSDTDTETL